MKKHWKFFMASAAVLTLAACGSDDEPKDKNDETPIVQDESDTTTEPATDEKNDTDDNLVVETDVSKEEYLTKLSEMEEADKTATAATTTVEMEAQESERLGKWQAEVDTMVSMIKEKLSEEEVTAFDESHTKWAAERDARATAASEVLEDGSGANLELLATKAELTKERAYELAAKHLK